MSRIGQPLSSILGVVLAAIAVVGQGATITWDADGTTGGLSDGGGAWLGANQWWDGTSNVTWTSGDDAVFGVGGTGGAVTLSATTAATSITFNPFSGTYTIGTAGQTLTLGSGGLTMNSGAGDVTLSSPVTLGAAQSWTNNSSSLLTASAAITNGGNLFTVAGSGNTTLAAVSGAGGLTKSGAGTLSLAGANTYTGGTIVSGGTLTLASGGVSGYYDGVISGSLTVSNGATVNATQAWSLGAGGPNSAVPTSRSVTDISLNGGTLNITSSPGIEGGMSPTTITMTGGSITGQPVQWYYGNSSAVSLVTNASSTTSTVSAPIVLRLNKTAGAGSLTFDVAAGTTPNGVDLLVSGAISNSWEEGSGGRIIKSGAGTLQMTAINSYTEGTTVQAGTLSLGNGGASGVIRGSLVVNAGARVNASASGWSLGYGGTRAGADFSGNSVTSIAINGGLLNITNPESGAGLSANEIVLTGGTIGGVSFGWYNSNTLTPTLRTLASSSRSTLSGGISLRLGTSGTLTFDVASGSTADGVDLLVSGPITNSTAIDSNIGGSLVKTGAGTLVLAGANTSTGGLVVSGGTVAIQGSLASNQNFTISNATLATAASGYNAFGASWTSGTTTINAGGLLFAGNATSNAHNLFDVILAGGTMSAGAGSLNGALANWYINGGIVATGGTTSTISASLGRTAANAALAVTVDAGSTLNVSGPIVNLNGANGLTKSGAGALTFGNVQNSYTGGTIVDSGTITLGNGGASGNIRGSLTINQGATVNASAFGWSLGYGGTRAGAAYAGNSVTSIAINGGLLNFTNELSGGGLSASEIVLTGGTIGGASFGWINTNTLTPTLRTLASSSRSTLAGGISLRLGTSGTLTFDVASGSTADGIDLLVSGPITTSTDLAPDGTHAGNIAKTGAGTLALTAANTFTGGTLISAGRLRIDSTGSLTASSGITINGGELKYNSATALTRPLTFTAGTISGTGTIGTAVTVAANDILSPGNSPGSQAYTAGLTWSGSGSYLWELNSLSGTAGVNWDVINVSGGTFDLAGLSAGNRFILDLTTLTGANATGPLDVAYDGGTYTFPIASYTSLSTSLGTTALTDLTSLFDIRLTNWANPAPTLSNVSVRINGAADGLE